MRRRPENETAPLTSVLAEANRNGYGLLPTGAPPGGDAQQAVVGGFCGENVASRIEAAVLRTDLIALVPRTGGATRAVSRFPPIPAPGDPADSGPAGVDPGDALQLRPRARQRDGFLAGGCRVPQ
ncbi:DUF6919 domain-containing protein [Streptomyces sp. NPDC056160]|uniref:DUF6919 domain-containing protein n=1 Tax=Streptomyces sp. NPDC056160 TaxID=3345731 RepID=UPI0035E31662